MIVISRLYVSGLPLDKLEQLADEISHKDFTDGCVFACSVHKDDAKLYIDTFEGVATDQMDDDLNEIGRLALNYGCRIAGKIFQYGDFAVWSGNFNDVNEIEWVDMSLFMELHTQELRKLATYVGDDNVVQAQYKC